ncbi:hypothetical protein [Micromonospora tarensis]|uniref:Uncharacterized protein n=1 Tax=Micromonospora tarensis TaxID=2806100 RepID=A0ABS1YEH7_9ACTN|nr:hypothetical protein [Micromonospora tarensis]MBM0275805.1 hypothetical protein [Micromonospora tarensis]
MSVSIAATVRITTKSSAVWRNCRACGSLAPLAPDQDCCPSCGQSTTARRRPVAGKRRSGRNSK